MAVFSKIISEFDGSNDLAQAEREALNALASLADSKRELFASEINLLILDAGTGTNKTVPISKVMRSDGLSRAYTSHSAKDISETLKTALGGFIEGGTNNIINGVFTLLSKTLEIFLGSTEGQESTRKTYFVYATDFSIYRVDVMAWSRSVSAVSLKTKIEQSTAFTYVISNVDVDKITWGDFIAIFALQLDNTPDVTKEQREEARARMRETWTFLKGPGMAALDTEIPSYAKIEGEYILPLIAS
jgi:hypothetical protein